MLLAPPLWGFPCARAFFFQTRDSKCPHRHRVVQVSSSWPPNDTRIQTRLIFQGSASVEVPRLRLLWFLVCRIFLRWSSTTLTMRYMSASDLVRIQSSSKTNSTRLSGSCLFLSSRGAYMVSCQCRIFHDVHQLGCCCCPRLCSVPGCTHGFVCSGYVLKAAGVVFFGFRTRSAQCNEDA